MAKEKLNLSLDKEVKENLIRLGEERGMNASEFVTYMVALINDRFMDIDKKDVD